MKESFQLAVGRRRTGDRGEGTRPSQQWEMSWDLINEKGPAILRSGEDSSWQRSCRRKTMGDSRLLIQEFGGKLIGRDRGQDLSRAAFAQQAHSFCLYSVLCAFIVSGMGKFCGDFHGERESSCHMCKRVTPVPKGYGSDITQGRIWAIPRVLAISPLFSVLLLKKNQQQNKTRMHEWHNYEYYFQVCLDFLHKKLELLITHYFPTRFTNW